MKIKIKLCLLFINSQKTCTNAYEGNANHDTCISLGIQKTQTLSLCGSAYLFQILCFTLILLQILSERLDGCDATFYIIVMLAIYFHSKFKNKVIDRFVRKFIFDLHLSLHYFLLKLLPIE